MIGHKLPNKTKSATVAEPKLFHQLNNPLTSLENLSESLLYLVYKRGSRKNLLPQILSSSLLYFDETPYSLLGIQWNHSVRESRRRAEQSGVELFQTESDTTSCHRLLLHAKFLITSTSSIKKMQLLSQPPQCKF
jgi:hypothetical protein